MRHLLLTPSIEGKDGVSCLSRRVALALRDITSEEVSVWSLADNGDVPRELAGAGITLRGARGDKLRMASWSMSRLLVTCDDLVVIVMHAHLAPLSLPFHVRGARVVHVLHGIEVWKPLTRLQRKSFRNARDLLCVSAYSAELFGAANPGLGDVRVCHPGLPKGDAAECPEDRGFALMVGRMVSSERYKGHDVLLDQWAAVLKKAPDAKLTIVGDGDDRERLVARSRERGFSDSIRFTGKVEDEELERLYRQCSFFVMPSTHEGFGLVFLEAMRAAKACIGGAGAASEIIERETTGYVVDPSEGGAVAEAMIGLFVHRDRREAMGARGRARFEKHFTSERYRERLRDALRL